MEHTHDWVITGWTRGGSKHFQLIQWKCKAPDCPHYDDKMGLNGYTWTRAIRPNPLHSSLVGQP